MFNQIIFLIERWLKWPQVELKWDISSLSRKWSLISLWLDYYASPNRDAVCLDLPPELTCSCPFARVTLLPKSSDLFSTMPFLSGKIVSVSMKCVLLGWKVCRSPMRFVMGRDLLKALEVCEEIIWEKYYFPSFKRKKKTMVRKLPWAAPIAASWCLAVSFRRFR